LAGLEAGDVRQERRLRLRRLDWCLCQLEEAQEGGQRLIGAALAERLSPVEARICAEMPVKSAIGMVLSSQGEVLDPSSPRRPPERPGKGRRGAPMPVGMVGCSPAPLDEVAARALTDRIRHAVGDVCLLLWEAHQSRAWSALGYRTWQDYVRGEFHISRTRSYELLDHARVVRAVEDASGVSAIADINVLTARQLKPRLPQLIEAIRTRLRRDGRHDPRALVLEVIREEKERAHDVSDCSAAVAGAKPRGCHERRREQGFNPVDLRRAIEYLAALPDPADLASRVGDALAEDLEALNCAARWLRDFTAACRGAPEASDRPARLSNLR
jgi:hypothetical protein